MKNDPITIELTFYEDPGTYRADLMNHPGTPYVGDGDTAEVAVACLFARLDRTEKGGWMKYCNFDKPIKIINKTVS